MRDAPPKIELVYDADCPNVEHARARLREAIAEDGRALQWTEWASDDPSLPDHARGHASPTILINHRDVAPDHPRANACRLYDQGNGTLHPAPPASAITAALRPRSP
jgi:RecB family exonuclease